MPVDYSRPRTSAARPAVNKNRPKKRVGGLFLFAILGALVVTFVAGVLTGWFVFSRAARKAAATAAVAGGQPESASTPVSSPPGGGEGQVQEPSLTFYETLPKGGKAVIGTGLNPKREDAASPAHPAVSAPPHVPQQQAVSPAPAKTSGTREESAKTQEVPNPPAKASEKDAATRKPAPVKGNFCVQVASYKDRKEAEAMRAKVAARGLDVYIVESNVPDKGVWYRIRVGKHLEQAEADVMVKKAGKGAIVIAE